MATILRDSDVFSTVPDPGIDPLRRAVGGGWAKGLRLEGPCPDPDVGGTDGETSKFPVGGVTSFPGCGAEMLGLLEGGVVKGGFTIVTSFEDFEREETAYQTMATIMSKPATVRKSRIDFWLLPDSISEIPERFSRTASCPSGTIFLSHSF
ncbi:MAG: hypothetical protein VST70_04180 [Nitrospirota bacterium]|nr:hypothetical protein [Nitrospirota bacterium]